MDITIRALRLETAIKAEGPELGPGIDCLVLATQTPVSITVSVKIWGLEGSAILLTEYHRVHRLIVQEFAADQAEGIHVSIQLMTS